MTLICVDVILTASVDDQSVGRPASRRSLIPNIDEVLSARTGRSRSRCGSIKSARTRSSNGYSCSCTRRSMSELTPNTCNTNSVPNAGDPRSCDPSCRSRAEGSFHVPLDGGMEPYISILDASQLARDGQARIFGVL